jgi:hypothetical protein
MSGKGKQYELDTVRDLAEATTDDVWATRPDFSGNSKHAFADVALVWPDYADYATRGAFLELKKRTVETGKRTNVMSGSKQEQSGMDELSELVEKCPPWGRPIVGVKFPNRALITFFAERLLENLKNETVWDGAVGQPKSTRGNNISMRKPTLDEWDSATGGMDDVPMILKTSGVDDRYRK